MMTRLPVAEIVKKTGWKKSDDFQTPAYALDPLVGYLYEEWRIWEPAAGKGNIAKTLRAANFKVYESDIIDGLYAKQDFLTSQLLSRYDCIVTNPPYSLKDEFLARCYELGKPFALLMTITALEGLKRQALYKEHGLQLILMNRRIDYETPHGGNSGAWFASAWFTWGLDLPSDLVFEEITK